MDEDRKPYQQKMESTLNQCAEKIGELLAKAENTAKAGYKNLARELEGKQDVASRRFQELKSSSDEAWKDLRPGFENAWKELREAFEKAAKRF